MLKDEESRSSQVPHEKITFNYKLFKNHHVADILRPSCIHVPKGFSFSIMTADVPVVPHMSFDLCDLTASTMLGEIKHLE